jgi:hypothetical protein
VRGKVRISTASSMGDNTVHFEIGGGVRNFSMTGGISGLSTRENPKFTVEGSTLTGKIVFQDA